MKVRHAVKAWSPFRVQFKKKSYPWVQLAGHEGEFPWREAGIYVSPTKDVSCSLLSACVGLYFWHWCMCVCHSVPSVQDVT